MPETVRVQAQDGRWETLGVDRFPGILPEGLEYTFSDWGPDSAAFTLKRDTGLDHPDLTEFTPLEVLVGGSTVWSGFVIDTPASGDDALAVNALGNHYYLDDDVYEPFYVYDSLQGYQDIRQHPDSPLTTHSANWRVEQGENGIIMTTPSGVPFIAGQAGGVMIDTGAAGRIKRVTIEYESSNNSGASAIYAIGTDLPNWTLGAPAGREDYISGIMNNASAGQIISATSTTAHRYLTIFHYCTASFTPGVGTDHWFRIKSVRIYSDVAFESGGSSALKAGGSTGLIADALKRAPMLDQSTAEIAATTLNLRDYSPGRDNELRTPRAVMEFANAFHGYRIRVGADRRLAFAAQANRASLSVNVGRGGAKFVDASTNSGREVYNRILGRGRTGSGLPVAAEFGPRSALDYALAPPVINGTFDANVTGWTAGPVTTLAWEAAGKRMMVQLSTAGAQTPSFEQTLVGTFLKGVRYRLSADVELAPSTQFSLEVFNAFLGTGYAMVRWDSKFDVTTVLGTPREVAFTFPNDVTNPKIIGSVRTLQTGLPIGATLVRLDNIAVGRPTATAVDRRNYARSKVFTVGFPVDNVMLIGLTQAYAAINGRSSLKGTLEIPANDLVTSMVGGRPIAVPELGNYVGELVNLANLIDPDTGAVGRLGVVAGVSVRGDAATLAIDNRRDSFEALLARMGVASSG
jgi:hypothetical protein